MLDNHFIIFMCATDNLASLIVEHCQHCRSKNKRLYIFFLLTTILTMLDNHIYNIHVRNRWYRFPYCQTLSNIVVLKNKRHDNFVFNDNSDNDWQFYKSWVRQIISIVLLSTIVNIVVLKNKRLDNFVFNDNTDNVRQFL